MPFSKTRTVIIYLLYALLFLLPWQTRYIYDPRFLSGGFWEYGSASLYATEFVLWAAIVIFAVARFGNKAIWKQLFTKEIFNARRAVLFWYAGALLLMAGLLARSVYPAASFNTLFHLLEGMCLVVVLVGLSLSQKEYRVALTAFWLGGVLQGLLGVYQFLSQEVFASKWLGIAYQTAKNVGVSVVEFGDQRWLRAYGSLGGPNPLGMYLAVCLLFGFVLFIKLQPLKRLHLYLLTIGQLVIVAGLVVSFSRGAWLGAALGITVLFWHVWRGSNVALRRPLRYLLGSCVALVLVCVGMLSPLFFARVSAHGRLEEQSISQRHAQYQQWYGVVLSQNPPLVGVGPGAYTFVLSHMYPKLPVWDYLPIHHSFLLVLAEYGMLGFALLCALHASALRQIKKNNWLFVPVIVVLVVTGLFEHFWWSLYVGQLIWWAVWGLGLASI